MRLIDLSQPLFDGAPNCPVHPPVSFRRTADHADGGWRMEEIAMATHTGSHLDAPLHKIAGGKSISDLPLETFVGPARIVDLRGIAPNTAIDADLLASRLPDLLRNEIVLLATGWGDKRAKTDEWLHRSPFVSAGGARWLVEKRVRGVGIDHYSIGGEGDRNAETHTILLEAGMWVVEELRFPDEAFALPRPVKFWALPLNWPGCSGAFCRPVIELAKYPPMFRPPETFRTARLHARPTRPEDAPAAFAAYASDPDVTRYLAWPPYQAPEPLAEFFRARAADWDGEGKHFTWLIRLQETDEVVGTIGCISEGGKVLFGYALGKKFWGQGLAAEALRYLVDWSLEQPGIYRAWAFCDTENPASGRVMEKAGMTREGIFRRWHTCPNLGPELRDCLIYARVN